MRTEGHLIIRGHDDGSFDVRFVPLPPAAARAMPTRRVPDPPALRRILREIGLEPERVVEVVSSPYVLHSIRTRVDRRAAQRHGLLPTPLGRALGLVTRIIRTRRRPAP